MVNRQQIFEEPRTFSYSITGWSCQGWDNKPEGPSQRLYRCLAPTSVFCRSKPRPQSHPCQPRPLAIPGHFWTLSDRKVAANISAWNPLRYPFYGYLSILCLQVPHYFFSHYFYSIFLPYFYFKSLKHPMVVCVCVCLCVKQRDQRADGQADTEGQLSCVSSGPMPPEKEGRGMGKRDKEESWEPLFLLPLKPNHHHLLLGASLPIHTSSRACPLHWRPIHTSLPDAASLEFSFSTCTHILSTASYHTGSLQRKINAMSLGVDGNLSSWPKFPRLGLTHSAGASPAWPEPPGCGGPGCTAASCTQHVPSPHQDPGVCLAASSPNSSIRAAAIHSLSWKNFKGGKMSSGTIRMLLMKGMFIAL